MTPNVRHWLPTQERDIVKTWFSRNGALPDNLIVRVSASKLDGAMPKGAEHGSQVFTKGNAPSNACGPCRACWDKSVAFVSYPKH
jgi:hypothetical protein